MEGLSSQERKIISSFIADEKPAVAADDLVAVHSVPRNSANQILSRLQRKGWLRRIKRGMYVVVPLGASGPEPAIEDGWPLAMELFAPCYISGWSAAEHWDLTDQIFNAIAVVTAKPQRRREQSIGGIRFRTRSVRVERIYGTKQIWLGSRRVEVADPHRMIIDILDEPGFGGGGRHTLDVVRAYWQSGHADAGRLLEHAVRYNRGTVFKRVGFTAEQFGPVDKDWLESCRVGVSAGISKLDPAGPSRGPIVSRWNLRINLPVEPRS